MIRSPAPVQLSFLDWLRAGGSAPFASRVALIVAHPDDEVIGAGAQLPRFLDLTLLHSTDGSPRNLLDAKNVGCTTREAYAALRRSELERALILAGQDISRYRSLGVVDQEASLDLAALTRQILAFLRSHRPELVLTQPYEGGHPDHDATAFAVHAAVHLLSVTQRPELLELTAYHNHSGAIGAGDFLPRAGFEVTSVPLSEAEQHLKRRLLNCFGSQRYTLSFFSTKTERFRRAPPYDFTRAPHPGTLYYEMFDWGMTGTRWRELACEALQALGIGDTL
jgi:N-acetylglucosamine malate deacetylase 2